MRAPSPNRPAATPAARAPAPARRAAPTSSRSRSKRGAESDAPDPLPPGLKIDPTSNAPVGTVAVVDRPAAPPPAPEPQHQPAPLPSIEQLQMMMTDGPMPLETASPDSGGAFFVRMVSPTNLVRAIPVGAVCNRLCCGWRFIENEPVIPRVNCPIDRQDTCDGEGRPGFYPRPRPLADTPMTTIDAVRVWVAEFVRDQQVFAGRRDLDHSYGRRLVSQFRAKT